MNLFPWVRRYFTNHERLHLARLVLLKEAPRETGSFNLTISFLRLADFSVVEYLRARNVLTSFSKQRAVNRFFEGMCHLGELYCGDSSLHSLYSSNQKARTRNSKGHPDRNSVEGVESESAPRNY